MSRALSMGSSWRVVESTRESTPEEDPSSLRRLVESRRLCFLRTPLLSSVTYSSSGEENGLKRGMRISH